ncbi:MAG TPA: cupin domain-containing protein [Acidobacteriaceae bacterium]|jgi:mannose-6-phosphate isomerase-like protein (cupin superfamily)|nr:cupin domain-containing protein [Acidobacteriaceae bacterium]
MSAWNRRDVCLAGAFAALGSLMAEAQAEHHPAAENDSPALSPAAMAQSRVFRFSQMKVEQHPNGGWGRPVMHGTLPTGEFVEVHETMLPPGQMPHPPHKHRNTEFVMIREGHVEYWNADGKHEPMGPGDLVYSASNEMHGMKNVGTVPATYFVVSISHGQL